MTIEKGVERYENLTRRNQRRFRRDLTEAFAWKSNRSFYASIKGETNLKPLEFRYIQERFKKYEDEQRGK